MFNYSLSTACLYQEANLLAVVVINYSRLLVESALKVHWFWSIGITRCDCMSFNLIIPASQLGIQFYNDCSHIFPSNIQSALCNPFLLQWQRFPGNELINSPSRIRSLRLQHRASDRMQFSLQHIFIKHSSVYKYTLKQFMLVVCIC